MYHLVPEEIVARYLEPHRYYHTLEHIYNGLSVIDMLTDSLPEGHRLTEVGLLEVKLAWWLHDAIYDIPVKRMQTNEEASAQLAIGTFPNDFRYLDGRYRDGKRIADLVRVTVYPNRQEKHSAAEAIINDADLFGLASPKPVYDRHTAQIRLEAPHLSDEGFNIKRREFLTKLVEQQRPLFKTELGLKLWESKALNNIYREIYKC